MNRSVRMLALGMLLTAQGARAAAAEIEAGPLWNDGDAQAKCPALCARHGNQYWTGAWRTTVPNVMSVCSCEVGAGQPYSSPGYVPAPYPPGAIPSNAVKMYPGTDFPGNDLGRGSMHADSPEACASLCLGDGRCGAFTFLIQENKCYLKAGPTTFDGSLVAVSGVIQSRPPMAPGYGGGYAVYPVQPMAPTMAAPTFCSIVGTPKCPGCSISCPPGRTPVCNQPVEGVTSFCARDASCKCE
jgi:hypothetical protein